MDIPSAHDPVDAYDRLMACLMRQPRRASDIPDGMDPRDVGGHQRVGNDMAAVRVYADLFQIQTVNITGDACRDNRYLTIDLVSLVTLSVSHSYAIPACFYI